MKKKPQPRIWTTNTYNRFSRYYDAFMKFFFPVGEKGREKIVDKLTSGSVLDVACGTGTLLKLAAKKGLDCYGIDLSEGMLVVAKEKIPQAELKLASYYDLPFPGDNFNHVVATNALSSDFIDAKKVLVEMIRVCKVGGWIYIAEWPIAEKDTFYERCIIWIASLSEDAPKDYLGIFKELGYEPEVDVLDKRYHVYGIRK